MVSRSSPVDGFRLAYDTAGEGPDVVLLHGWPGFREDYRHVVPLLTDRARVIVPDLRGFGESDKLSGPPRELYSAQAQVRSVLRLLDDLGIDRAVFGGYDVGSRVCQALVAHAPDRVAGLVMTPPQPGAGERLLATEVQQHFWYQVLHRLDLADEMLDGQPGALRAYLRHFWLHWSGPGHSPTDQELDRLVEMYGAPGAFTASIAWYRARPGPTSSAHDAPPGPTDRVATPTEILWPTEDPLFPYTWSDRLDEWYSDVRLTELPGIGHFVPIEAPTEFAAAVRRRLQ
ncbi:alpha/beta fold hydrolase [Nakamurella sp. YIM 132087]|uniref:Alpha/beta fold hydrolase n=1 Tax=Nakamurella alba TaxID=2665158 RepID=A0A7K1FHL0_9ACTN|nr:alpha/beta hydrolase [Nakamurella alba]MTD13617.1 alpha/beta fold hydrolase [Nakamurella alba]